MPVSFRFRPLPWPTPHTVRTLYCRSCPRTELGVGAQAVCELARRDDVDCVLVAIVGAAGLEVSHAALISNKRLALANKESLVVGGDLLMPLALPGQLIPVDSEHSAIYQCYLGENPREATAFGSLVRAVRSLAVHARSSIELHAPMRLPIPRGPWALRSPSTPLPS